MKIASSLFATALLIASVACDQEKKPSYEELQKQNQELRSQVDDANARLEKAHEHAQDIQSNLENGDVDAARSAADETEEETQ